MEMKDFTILKRDGSRDRFSLDKIMNAVIKAFNSVNEETDLCSLSKILSHLDMHEDIKVEDIQNQVEMALMQEGYYKVAKSFMLYRQSIQKTVKRWTNCVSLLNTAMHQMRQLVQSMMLMQMWSTRILQHL